MPHASVKLKPGVDTTETPALNETGISSSNLIRFVVDRNGIGLIQKLGGWTKYYGSKMASKVRALLAWQDTNNNAHVAFGTELVPSRVYSQLGVITNGTLTDITPTYKTDNVAVSLSTAVGSNIVVISDNDTSVAITNYDTVYIQTQISVGGIILFGMYPCITLSSTQYEVLSVDLFGNAVNATAAVTNGGAVPSFSTTNTSSIVTVTLNNHGYSAGDTFPCLVSTTVGGITIYGNYIVQEAGLSINSFKIQTATKATSTSTGSMNGGQARYLYSFGVGGVTAGTGYGDGLYGAGGYGGSSVPSSSGTKISANDWTLDNWGEILVSCPINDTAFQPLYLWNPIEADTTATVIPQAPPLNDGAFVAMPQRQIISWGTTFTGIQDPLLVRWCDVNNFNVWIADYTNQAGSYRIPRGSKIVACMQGPQQGLLWTDLSLWTMQYIGQPYVYSFNEIGFGCGLIGRKAAAVINDVVFWMSGSQFFTLASNGVKPVPCPVWDVIFQDLDTSKTNLIRTAVNSRFNEVTWYYPTKSSGGEVNAYVKLNVALMEWDFGTLARSAWIDQSVAGKPIGADPNSLYLYQHETSNDADGVAMNSTFTTGYFSMAEGDVMTFVDQIWPDMKWGEYGGSQGATVDLTFNVTDYPGTTPRTYGPYSTTVSTQYISSRFRGRLVSITISSSDTGSFWRIGNIRYRLQQDGKF